MTRTRNDRLQLTVTPAMRVALEVLAGRTGLPLAAQATMILRQALDRTIGTPEVQKRLGQANAYRTNAQWLRDTATERAVETQYESTQTRTEEAKQHAAEQPDATGTFLSS